MESQTILVLGATGASGLAFIDESLKSANPPNLVLYVRSPSKLSQDISLHSRVSIVTGELSDYDALDSAMKTHSITTVVSFLGAYASVSAMVTRSTETPIADSFPTIIQAMKDNNIQRLLVLSSPSYWVYGKDISTWSLSLFGLIPKLLVPQGVAEMVRIAETVNDTATDLDWTIFRIPHLTDGPADLPVWAGYAGPAHRGGFNLSRRSLARWVLGEIEDRKWTRGVPSLGNC